MHEALSVETARELLDFTGGGHGGGLGSVAAEEQLVGAVALHNLLAKQRVAYLADEVGMGKTYVALGAMALFRHFRPDFRVLVLAPRENIQKKWVREWTNFVSKIVRIDDLAVRGMGGEPARALVRADSLVDLVAKTSADPDRDFLIRLPSFSLPLWTYMPGAMDARRRELLRVVPWLPPDLLHLHNHEAYKRNFARAINCALPEFDLVIVDEGHNLKAGWREGRNAAIRNTVIGCALAGRKIDDEFASTFRGYGAKAKRVLFLSATPVEDDFRQLWNQLDLFGFGTPWSDLKDESLPIETRREVVRKLLIRRSAELMSAGRRLTKTEYRTEWRAGGVSNPDKPLEVPNDRQKLAVALVQKKVAELIGTAEHKHSFQVGLLASFESFMQTAVSTSRLETAVLESDEEEGGDSGVFHRSAAELAETRGAPKEGVDVHAINRIARDHVRAFGKELPHPKMDSLVADLARKFRRGEKSLVFVRRVASVDEIQRKLEEEYDDWIIDYLRRQLKTESLRLEVETQFAVYRQAREAERHRIRAGDVQRRSKAEAERSSVDSFFAWFFRGDGPPDVRSGATIAGNLEDESGNYVSLLEDNYVSMVLGVPPERVAERLAGALGREYSDVLGRVGLHAIRYVARGQRTKRREQFRAVQRAALEFLAETPTECSERARDALSLVFSHERTIGGGGKISGGVERWLNVETVFTALRKRPRLREAIWPEVSGYDFRTALREQELRRELFSSIVRKGHPIVDLFTLIANRIGTLRLRARETEHASRLVDEFLDLLEAQRDGAPDEFHSYIELSQAAKSFDVILRLNAPDLERKDLDLSRATTILGGLVRAQRPIGGMAGQVNSQLVRQFRMPGYPLVLVTTDLLKEGEDLHTFCANVVHYGIAWMPSELEQRVGRVDRVGSLTERRLATLTSDPTPLQKLQVYYPHLRETVEVLQVRRVYERLNRFLRIMHEGLGAADRESSRIDVLAESLRAAADVPPITEPLRSAYRVSEPMLRGRRRALRSMGQESARTRKAFASLASTLTDLPARLALLAANKIVGECRLGSRVQPFILFLRSLHGTPLVRCISPVGRIDTERWNDLEANRLNRTPFVRISLERNEQFKVYDVATEGDVIFNGDAGLRRVRDLVSAAAEVADRLELQLIGTDRRLDEVEAEFGLEPSVER